MTTLDEAGHQLESIMDEVYDLVVEMWNNRTAAGQASPQWWSTWLQATRKTLLQVSPGVGKTYWATKLVNRLWEAEIPAIYLVPNHDFAGEILSANPGWQHWQGHERICEVRRSRSHESSRRYPVSVECGCGYNEQFGLDGPTVAPVNFLMAPDPEVLWGVWPENWADPHDISKFGLRIVDEMNLTQAIDGMCVTASQLKSIADTHPEPGVQITCTALGRSLQANYAIKDQISGGQLYSDSGVDLGELLEALNSVEPMTQSSTWSGIPRGRDLPPNLPPFLVPIMKWELSKLIAGETFNPRIYVRQGPMLSVNWRRQAITPVPTLFLDATTDPLMLAKIHYQLEESEQVDIQVQVPANVEVVQYMGSEYSKSTLGLYPFVREKSYRKGLYDEISQELSEVDRQASIGVITHRELLHEAEEYLRSLGFTDVRHLYFHNLRSSNILKDCNTLVVIGTPIPAPEDFARDASTFFWDEDLVDTATWGIDISALLLRNGGTVPLGVNRPNRDERVKRLHWQLCEAEMIQAIHRTRSVRVPEELHKIILVMSERPIPGIPVDRFAGRWGRVISAVKSLVAERGRVSVADVVRSLPDEWPSNDERSLVNTGSGWVLGRGTSEVGTRPNALAALAEVSWVDDAFVARE